MSTITVTMAFYGAHQWLREAVESILAQTYEDWHLVIVNDADPDSPWPYLAGLLDDPRITCMDLHENRGRYFIDAVIFEAFEPEFWALQDPDDHADPRRFELMIPIAQEYGAAFAPTWLYRRAGRPPIFDTSGMDLEPAPHRIRHMVGYGSGVIAGERLSRIGGFHPGFRVAYDTYMMNALKLTGPWRNLPDPPLQHKLKRPGGLTMTPETGLRSAHREEARARLDGLWQESWERHERGEPIAPVITRDTDPALAAAVAREAARLGAAEGVAA